MATPIEAHPTSWQSVLLVCRKCSKKLDGGFGPEGDETLVRVLKQALRDAGQRRSVRVIETKCLGLCPKRAVTVLPASSPGALLAVPAGTAAEIILAEMGLSGVDGTFSPSPAGGRGPG